MAQRAEREVRVGTSGWHYAHWVGRFYPTDVRPGEYLARYARAFDTVEINNTFYRLPAEATFRAWRDAAPAGFLFAVKGSRYITHMKRLQDPEAPLQSIVGRAETLGEHLGPILFQLPPNWRFDEGRLRAFLDALPAGHRYAMEFRNETWFTPRCFDALARHSVAHCIHDMGGQMTPLAVTSDLVYVRQHGPKSSPEGHYTDEHLSWLAERIEDWRAEDRDVYCYFNNDWQGHAIRDAQTLRHMLAGRHAQARPRDAG